MSGERTARVSDAGTWTDSIRVWDDAECSWKYVKVAPDDVRLLSFEDCRSALRDARELLLVREQEHRADLARLEAQYAGELAEARNAGARDMRERCATGAQLYCMTNRVLPQPLDFYRYIKALPLEPSP